MTAAVVHGGIGAVMTELLAAVVVETVLLAAVVEETVLGS